jgi:hypothetical protein
VEPGVARCGDDVDVPSAVPGVDDGCREVGHPGLGSLAGRRDAEVLRPHAGHGPAASARGSERLAGERLPVAEPAVLTPLAHQPVRHADELRDVLAGRPFEHVLRRVELLDRAFAHDREAVAESEGLRLIVGHEDRGVREPRVQLVDLRADEVTQPGVQV